MQTGPGVTLIDVMLAVAAREARWAQACERVDAIHTGATIEAGAFRAVGRVVLTVYAAKAQGAGAGIAVHTVSAVGTIAAGVTGTFVDVLLTEGTLEARQAVAEGRVYAISAGAAIVAGVGPTVVDVRLTVAPCVAGQAVAAVAAIGILAGGGMAAGALDTLIDVHVTGLPLPACMAHTGKALIVLGLLALATISAGVGGTWGQQHLTCGSCVGQRAVALVPRHVIDAGALVQTWVGGTFIDVGLAVGAAEALPACAHIAAGHVPAGPTVGTGVGLTLIVVNITVGSTPAWVAVTLVSIEAVLADTVDAGVAAALVDLRQACGVVVALRAAAGEAVDTIFAGASVVAGVACTLVNVYVTHTPCIAWLTRTLIAINLVYTGASITGVAGTVIQVDLTVGACGPLQAEAQVSIVAILAGAPVAAGLAMALVDVGLAVMASVARPAQAGEGGHPILAGPIVAGVGVTLVDVHFTVGPCIAFCAHTAVGVGPVKALGTILARRAGTLIHIILA